MDAAFKYAIDAKLALFWLPLRSASRERRCQPHERPPVPRHLYLVQRSRDERHRLTRLIRPSQPVRHRSGHGVNRTGTTSDQARCRAGGADAFLRRRAP
jgi:hypothetical protein